MNRKDGQEMIEKFYETFYGQHPTLAYYTK
jgi:hypothetical protein